MSFSGDGLVQIQPDSTGKKVDTTSATRADGTVVERQRMALVGDRAESPALNVEGEPGQGVTSGEATIISLLRSIDAQLRELLFLTNLRGG